MRSSINTPIVSTLCRQPPLKQNEHQWKQNERHWKHNVTRYHHDSLSWGEGNHTPMTRVNNGDHRLNVTQSCDVISITMQKATVNTLKVT